MTPTERGTRIREAARALGFDLVGIAAAGEAADGEHFEAWLRAGRHGEMDYMAKRAAERTDPRVLLPGAKSVIVVAVTYSAEDVPGRPIARYAQGRDYHNPMRRRLRKLARMVKRLEPDTRTYLAVDTGPVLERTWAERAGIGWVGKASNLVTPTHSSWVLLGTLIIDRLCDYDAPARDRCGTCDACIPVCPTGAILAPRVVDARLCISYLTIEARGGIPRDLRAAVGQHLFGCDDCQEVCPWNRFAVHAPNAMLAGRSTEAAPGACCAKRPTARDDPLAASGVLEKPGLAVHPVRLRWAFLRSPASLRSRRARDGLLRNRLLDAARFLEMDEASFVRDFEGTALRRAGLTGLKRNALVVLGNAGDERAVPQIARVLRDDPSPMLRGHAAWALGQLGARAVLASHRAHEFDRDVLGEIDAALTT